MTLFPEQDKRYWDFGGQDSKYNYIRPATNAGFATLHWSRPGTGNSSSANPYSILQADVQAAVLIELTKRFRSGELHGDLPTPSGRVFHVGHSFGSIMSNVLAAKNPELSDGVSSPASHTTLLSRLVSRSRLTLTWPKRIAQRFGAITAPAS